MMVGKTKSIAPSLKLGDAIIWVGNFDGSENIRAGIITKISTDFELVWVDNAHKVFDYIIVAYCWPIRYQSELQAVIDKRRELKRAFDDSMGLVYQLRNKWKSEGAEGAEGAEETNHAVE